MSLQNVETKWKTAVLAGDADGRREAEQTAADVVPETAAAMSRLSDEEARRAAAN